MSVFREILHLKEALHNCMLFIKISNVSSLHSKKLQLDFSGNNSVVSENPAHCRAAHKLWK